MLKKNISKTYNVIKNSEFLILSLKNSGQVALRFIIGIINIKVISIWIGASGLALTGQFTNFLQIAGTFSGIGFNHGITKLISQYSNSTIRKKLIISNGLALSLGLSIVTSILLYLFSDILSISILKDIRFKLFFKLAGIVVFSLSFSNLILSILNGAKKYKSFIQLNIGMIISSFIFLVPMTYLYGLNGAILSQYFSGIIHIILALYFAKDINYKSLNHFRISFYISKRLIHFGLMLVLASSIPPLVSIVIRNLIISEYGLEVAGWWEGVSRISKTYLGLCISTISLYYLPQISKHQSSSQLNKLIHSTIKQAMPIVTFGLILIFISKDIIVKVLFTKDFYEMKKLFLFQNIGDTCRMFNWFFAITIIIKEKITIYIYSEIIMAVTYLTLVYLIIPYLGINYSTLPYMINTFIYLGVSQYIYRKHIL
ncbi:O-antigen translocase [Labilibacter sediminis]|nr:O-antigen translocase [Labilibacter sediminis]